MGLDLVKGWRGVAGEAVAASTVTREMAVVAVTAQVLMAVE